MTSVIGTPFARAPRNVRSKNPQLLLKSKETSAGASGVFQNISDVVSYIDKFIELVQSNSVEKDLRSAVVILCANLKMFGAQLEIHYKDQLDRVFIHLRNAGRDDSLDKISRLHLLEVVELRAGRWAAQDQVCSYYQSKLTELQGNNITDGMTNVGQLPSSGQNEPSPPVSPLPLLLPGEVVKFSGKYSTSSTTITTNTSNTTAAVAQVKNSIKDEVVIRNADSGKVNPGATERLVQITGPGQDNIERARQLIEQTIQRNASPVRQLDPTVSGQMSNTQDVSAPREPRKQSLLDSALDDYQHTVVVGDQSIKITGLSLELVQTAKLVLDEYFATLINDRQRTVSSCSSMDDGVVMSCPSQESPRESDAATTIKKLKYDRESLLHFSNSPYCRQPPTNFDLVLQNAPEIARKELRNELFFDGKVYLENYPVQLTSAYENTFLPYDASEDV